jgi:hypothetical protein
MTMCIAVCSQLQRGAWKTHVPCLKVYFQRRHTIARVLSRILPRMIRAVFLSEDGLGTATVAETAA